MYCGHSSHSRSQCSHYKSARGSPQFEVMPLKILQRKSQVYCHYKMGWLRTNVISGQLWNMSVFNCAHKGLEDKGYPPKPSNMYFSKPKYIFNSNT